MTDPVIQVQPSTPESLGQKTSAKSIPVVLPSDYTVPIDTSGFATESTLSSIRAAMPGSLLKGITFDYIGVNLSGATTDVYTYYEGGSGGTLRRTITVTYTDATKNTMQSIAAV